MESEIEIPKNDCPGCASRVEIIKTLADRVDELEGNKKLRLVEEAAA